MSHATTRLKKQLEVTIDALQELRDEVRVKAHLGAMDARDKWREIEPILVDAEDRAKKVASKLDEIGAILSSP